MRNRTPLIVGAVGSILFAAGTSFAATDAPAGHASAAPAAHAAAAPAAAQSVSHEMNPTAGAGRAEPAAMNSNAHAMARQSTSGAQTTGDHRRHDFDHRYNVIYGDPWYGYNGGWNSGWYGNGYTNNGYYNDVTFSPSDNSTPVDNDGGTLPKTPAPSPAIQVPAGSGARLESEIDHSPQMSAANTAVQSAQAAYDAARQQVLAQLQSNPDYQQALAQRHQASKSLQAAKASPSSMPAIVDAATVKLDAADKVTRIEEETIAKDPVASAAKTHLAQAIAARDALRADMLVHH